MPKFQVTRSIVVNASAEQVYGALADFNTWTTWSPWLIAEPEAAVTVSPDSSSVGSTYAWAGTITGQGKLQHRKLVPHVLIEDDLNFVKPFKSYADVIFRLSAEASGTKVTWSMNSSMPWFLFFMVPMMKTLIGMDYSRGLAMFKEWLETGNITSQTTIHGIESAKPFRMVGIAASCAVDQVSVSMEQSFGQTHSELERLKIPMDGEMISVYTKFRVKEAIFEYISGYIVPEHVQVPEGSPLKSWTLPTTRVFRVEHRGAYQHLGNAWSIANQLVRFKKLKQHSAGTYEIYRTVPPVADAALVTDVFLPLR